jgi:hypothetical protein
MSRIVETKLTDFDGAQGDRILCQVIWLQGKITG